MIRFIAAIDLMGGIATDTGIPWNLPSDHEHYVKKVSKGRILMGYGTYLNHSSTLHGRTEYVATTRSEPLRDGFEAVHDVDTFLSEKALTWVLGGSKLFNAYLDKADELYITQVNGDFNCTKHFPSFEKKFTLIAKSCIKKENGTEFQYQVWKNNRLLTARDSEKS